MYKNIGLAYMGIMTFKHCRLIKHLRNLLMHRDLKFRVFPQGGGPLFFFSKKKRVRCSQLFSL